MGKNESIPRAGNIRATAAAVGCALILMTGFGSMSVINAAAPLIMNGIGATLVSYSMGPMIATLAAFAGSLVAAKVIDLITPRACLVIGTVCVTAVLAIIGFANDLVAWYAANVLNGVVLSFGSQAACAGIVAEYYGQRSPSVFGVVVGAMAFLVAGEVLVESVFLAVFDYRTVFFVFSAFSFVVGMFANFVLIGFKPKAASVPSSAGASGDAGQRGGAIDFDGSESVEAGGGFEGPEEHGLTLGQAMRSPVLYLFFAAMFVAAFPYQGYSAYGAYYFSYAGLDASSSAMLLSGFALFTAAFSLVAGFASRKLGASKVALAVFVGFAVGIALLVWWASLPVKGLLVWVSVAFCGLIGLVQTLPALFVPQLFGMRAYAAINAVGIGGMHAGSAVLFVVISVVMEAFGYNAGFVALAACGLASAALFLLAMGLSPIRHRSGIKVGENAS